MEGYWLKVVILDMLAPPGVLNVTKYTTTEKGPAARLALCVVGGSRGGCTYVHRYQMYMYIHRQFYPSDWHKATDWLREPCK